MNKEFYSEQIDAYLRNTLSASEKAALESKLNQDPILKSEFQLQKDTIECLQEFRKQELKQRLNRIDVSETSTLHFNRFLWLLPSAAASVLIIWSLGFWPQEHKPGTLQAQKIESLGQEENPRVLLEDLDSGLEENSEKERLETKSKQDRLVQEALSPRQSLPLYSPKKETPKNKRQSLVSDPLEKQSFSKSNQSKVASILSASSKARIPVWQVKGREELEGIYDGQDEPKLEDIASNNELSYQYYNNELFIYHQGYDKGEKIRLEIDKEMREFLFYNHHYFELDPESVLKTQVGTPIADPTLIKLLNQKRKEGLRP